MSNPAVIILSEVMIGRGESFRIEDNIGEAIHLHCGQIRVDFTVRDFLAFSGLIGDSLSNLIEADGFSLKQFDPIFLASLGDGICDIKSVQVEKILLSQLEVNTESFIGLRVRKLSDSRMYQALKGNKKKYLNYRQKNLYGQSNSDRLSAVLSEIRINGYPDKERYIVLFNNQNFIRDGQHRAAVLYHLHGDMEIPVLRVQFHNDRFKEPRFPWLRALPGHIFQGFLMRMTWGYRRCRRIGGTILRYLKLR